MFFFLWQFFPIFKEEQNIDLMEEKLFWDELDSNFPQCSSFNHDKQLLCSPIFKVPCLSVCGDFSICLICDYIPKMCLSHNYKDGFPFI